MAFRPWFYRTDPQSIGGQFGTLSGFLRKLFGSERAKKTPRNIFQTEKFQTIFEKRTPIYSLAAPLLGLAKSIYCFNLIQEKAFCILKNFLRREFFFKRAITPGTAVARGRPCIVTYYTGVCEGLATSGFCRFTQFLQPLPYKITTCRNPILMGL